jgi:hypothetical protein
MNSEHYRSIASAMKLARDDQAALRQAQRDVERHCGLALDGVDAADVYRSGLESRGVSRNDTAGLNALELRAVLRNLARHGSRSFDEMRSGMAYDDAAGGDETLSAILDGIPQPRDYTTRSDLRR